jgi:protein O-mannosyl-transferase
MIETKPDKTPAAPRNWERRLTYAPLLALAVMVLVIYSDSIVAGFVWDDHKLITANVRQNSLAKLWVSDFWQTGRGAQGSEYYRPLTTTSFLVDYWLFGDGPRGYHLTNLALYLGLAGLVYLLYLRLLGSVRLAFALTAVFVALPAHTENVAWVSGRTDLICAAAMLGSLLMYLRGEDGHRRDRVGAIILFALSLFGKEMSITLAAIVAVHQALNHGLSRRAVRATAPYALIALIFLGIHYLAAPHVQAENIYPGPAARLLNIIRNLGLGIGYSLAPGGFELIITATRDEAARLFPVPTGGRLLAVALPVVISLAALGIALWRREKMMALAVAAGLIALLPIIGIIPIGVVFALRFLLIPSFFFILFVGLLLARLLAQGQGIKRNYAEAALLTALAAAAVVYSAWSFHYASYWRDDDRLMAAVIKRAPEAAMAHFLQGNGLAMKEKNQEAAAHYEQAIKIRPNYPEAEYNLGVLLEKQGRFKEAEDRYRSALAHNPDFSMARTALANVLARTSRDGMSLTPKREAPPQ